MPVSTFINSRQRHQDSGAFRKMRLQQPRKDRLRERAVTGKTPMATRR
jgi:hypothetical protein